MENFTEITIKPSVGRTVKFKGNLLGEAKTSPNNSSSNYSGSVGRWDEYKIYQTKGKKYVCESFDGTQWQGSHSETKIKVCNKIEEMESFFENGRLFNELLEECKLSYEIEVE